MEEKTDIVIILALIGTSLIGLAIVAGLWVGAAAMFALVANAMLGVFHLHPLTFWQSLSFLIISDIVVRISKRYFAT